MKVILKMIYMKVKELKNIQIMKNMKVIFMRGFLKVVVLGFMLIIVNWKEYGKRAKRRVKQKK